MPDLGKKYDCFHCHTKFYNLGKPEAICPKCGANQKNAKGDEAPAPAPRPSRRAAVILEPIPDENHGEFGEETPAEPEDRELDDDEFEEGEELAESEEEEEEEY
jgi:predicted  nucleic acid-binding Zn-ribbon protein